MKLKDGQPTICSVLKGIRGKIENHMNNRGVNIRGKALRDVDKAIDMAKRMNDKLTYYKQKEHENG